MSDREDSRYEDSRDDIVEFVWDNLLPQVLTIDEVNGRLYGKYGYDPFPEIYVLAYKLLRHRGWHPNNIRELSIDIEESENQFPPIDEGESLD